ncbi:hypothetical protein BGZ58_010891 [Dissophora ornata]|nr:hypothetical protein BGZ58_010891 [Dissophora ornata]
MQANIATITAVAAMRSRRPALHIRRRPQLYQDLQLPPQNRLQWSKLSRNELDVDFLQRSCTMVAWTGFFRIVNSDEQGVHGGSYGNARIFRACDKVKENRGSLRDDFFSMLKDPHSTQYLIY